MDFKTFDENRNGHILNIKEDDTSIGHHTQNWPPYEPLSMGDKMRRSNNQSKVFDNNGSSNKGEAGGVINKNGEYGSVTYGF